ncbi:unnamed protein product [Pleuronectes platessa]|uniref:Uncharacterized protein n=1 Tax=Pleuronectes platessa TaxID=8262 RepID=A0A9N7VPM4_PLEPL|nr:unnamed protein product [Pleuronectes platessa]
MICCQGLGPDQTDEAGSPLDLSVGSQHQLPPVHMYHSDMWTAGVDGEKAVERKLMNTTMTHYRRERGREVERAMGISGQREEDSSTPAAVARVTTSRQHWQTHTGPVLLERQGQHASYNLQLSAVRHMKVKEPSGPALLTAPAAGSSALFNRGRDRDTFFITLLMLLCFFENVRLETRELSIGPCQWEPENCFSWKPAEMRHDDVCRESSASAPARSILQHGG